MNIFQQLRDATQSAHRSLETGLEIPQSIRSVGQYLELLVQYRELYTFLEPEVTTACAREGISEIWAGREKLPALAKDLAYFGVWRAPPMQSPADVPRLDCFASLVGCLYVVEGSTLGGLYLSRHFCDRFSVAPDGGCTFFSGYADQSRKMWNNLKEKLETKAGDAFDGEAAITSALATFAYYEYYLTRRPSDWLKIAKSIPERPACPGLTLEERT